MELRRNLRVHLRRLRRGEGVEATERRRLEARGLRVRRGRGSLADLPAPQRLDLERPLGEVLDQLREDRL